MILLVASHEETVKALVPLISNKGYRVAAVECGEEVVTKVRFQPPQMVIIDCDFKDSFEMLEKIRVDGGAGSLPVVMFAENNDHVRERALGKGANSFVAKGSLDWAALLDEIERYVGPPPG